MKIIHRDNIKPFRKESGKSTFIAYEYYTGNKTINVAEVIISGRYPDERRWAVNLLSTMMVRILSGEGRIAVRDKNGAIEYMQFKVDDAIEVEAGEVYAWEPVGIVRLFRSSSPAWTLEQHQIIE